jgi:putative ABC transport system permease protein
MKFLPFLIANLLRKKVRITMTIGSFTIALFLYCILATIERSFNQGVEVAGADRLVVINKTSLISPLPFSYKERLTQIPNVKHVTYAVWFGGIYQSEKNFFPQLAIDLKTFRGMYNEFKVAPQYWEAFLKDKEGCIVGPSTMKRFGWKVGDRVPLRGTIWPGTWEFNIRGTYAGTRGDDDLTQFWFRYDYLDERRLPEFGKGTVGWYMVKVDKIEKAAEVLAAIDKRFANSAYETKTDTEKSFASDFVKQIGNIKLIMLSIGGVVFFTLLLVTGSTMSMSVRERVGELATLKTIGFSDTTVLLLVMAEALTVGLVGGGIGVIVGKLYTLTGDPTGGLLPIFYLAPQNMITGLGLGIFIGMLSGLMPAVFAMRLRIVEALRRV